MHPPSVRRCRRCHEPAVIAVEHWDARLLGVVPLQGSGKTHYRCQSCGAGFTLYPWMFAWFLMGAMSGVSLALAGVLSAVGAVIALVQQGPAEAGVLLLVTVCSLGVSAALLTFAVGPQVTAWRNPVVPGARPPALRFGPAEGRRRCACGGQAPVTHKQAASILRLPGGTTSTHQCPQCQRRFNVPDRLAVAVRSILTLFCAGVGVLLSTLLPLSDLNGNHFFVLGVLGLCVVAGATVTGVGVYRRAQHPLV